MPDELDMRKVGEKTAKGGAIGAVAATAGILISGAIAANNPTRIDPAAQNAIAGAITAIITAVAHGFLNWLKHR